MKICVAGLWHLGVVTAACAADAGHRVDAFDEAESVVAGLANGILPVDEPGLAELVRRQLAAGSLRFTSQLEQALRDADVVWITYDTPVDANDRADVEYVLARGRAIVAAADPSAVILISSQLPVGSTLQLEEVSPPGRTLAYVPENLRLGDAVAAFMKPDRIVVGIRPEGDRVRIEALLHAFSSRIEWMSVESAELVKHGVNAFLGTSIAFANELARVAERVGADATEVERGLKTEVRIGPRAYLRAGAAFAGGTLARDIEYLTQIGEREQVSMPLFRAVRVSNDEHKQWPRRAVESLIGDAGGRLDGHVVGVWGLVYKQGTNTLRRSSSIELCSDLARAGATVRAHDSAVLMVPDELSDILTLCESPLEAAEDASAIVIETNWPSYRDVSPEQLVALMRTPIVVDANGYLLDSLGGVGGIRYVRLGGHPT